MTMITPPRSPWPVALIGVGCILAGKLAGPRRRRPRVVVRVRVRVHAARGGRFRTPEGALFAGLMETID